MDQSSVPDSKPGFLRRSTRTGRWSVPSSAPPGDETVISAASPKPIARTAGVIRLCAMTFALRRIIRWCGSVRRSPVPNRCAIAPNGCEVWRTLKCLIFQTFPGLAPLRQGLRGPVFDPVQSGALRRQGAPAVRRDGSRRVDRAMTFLDVSGTRRVECTARRRRLGRGSGAEKWKGASEIAGLDSRGSALHLPPPAPRLPPLTPAALPATIEGVTAAATRRPGGARA